jgi:phosphoglycerate dehydrogenase-like enzyme
MTKNIEVLITIPFNETQMVTIKESAPGLKIKMLPVRKVEEIPADIWAKTEVLYTDRVLPQISQVPLLRWVQFHFAGIDFAMEHPLINNSRMQVTNLSGSASSQAAEYILMMLLSLGHKLPGLQRAQLSKEWPKDRWDKFSPMELRGSNVCLVGYGSIGRQVARLLKPFGANVLAVKRDAMHPEDPGYTPDGMGDPEGDLFNRLYPYQAIKSVMSISDFIVVCAPLTSQTMHLIGEEEFSVCKPSAYIINISRGEIIHQDALITALQDKKLAGAALDVFAVEPLPEDNPLWTLPNVIISPHIAGNSRYYNDRAAELFAENLKRYTSGQSLLNQVHPEVGY